MAVLETILQRKFPQHKNKQKYIQIVIQIVNTLKEHVQKLVTFINLFQNYKLHDRGNLDLKCQLCRVNVKENKLSMCFHDYRGHFHRLGGQCSVV